MTSLADSAPAVRRALLEWFAEHGRRLAGRETADPWRLLVLEIASQQTQIERALEGAARFLGRFPTPAVLAAASPADAVRAWSGLGYNRRAIALWRAAVAVERDHGGQLPSRLDALEALPGVGPYTARAVAAQAFGLPVGPVDVNVARVVGRLLGSLPSAAAIQAAADNLVEPLDAARSVHALMDLAVLVCSRRAPRCDACPVAGWCASAGTAGLAAAPPAVGSGARAASGSAAPAARVPFAESRRWLRGALLRELREAEPGSWLALRGDRGRHGQLAVREALVALERDGLIELDPAGAARLVEGRGAATD